MLIDCDACSARGDACADCVVSVLLAPPQVVEWDEEERRALAVLADAGLIPRLRLVTAPEVVSGGPVVPAGPSRQPTQGVIPLSEPFSPGPPGRRPATNRRSDATRPATRRSRAG
ncbi:MAG: hypothetical protein IRZ08_03725 [Frankia sp.]|nr:hypothetical protein [Frankia sp.]